MSVGLAKLAEEDPTFQVHTDQETGQTIIAGMGELHLEIIVDRLKREFNVDCNAGNRRSPTVTAGHAVEKAEGKFVRQSVVAVGSRRHHIEPQESGKGYEVQRIVGGVRCPGVHPLDRQEASRSARERRHLYPVDHASDLADWLYHEVDSPRPPSVIAGSMATGDALQKSRPRPQKLIEDVELNPAAVPRRRHG